MSIDTPPIARSGRNLRWRVRSRERGATLVEYALLVGLISVVAVGGVKALGGSVTDSTERANAALGSPKQVASGAQSGDPSGGDGGTGGSGGGGGSGLGGATSTTTTTVAPTTTTTTTTAPKSTTTTTAPKPTTTSTTTPPKDPGTTTTVTAVTSSYYWWNGSSSSGNGQWVGTATFRNDWIRPQYLDLEVVRVHSDGKTTTETVQGFYVPANGSAEYAAWNNDAATSKGNLTGVTSITVTVKKVTTSDVNWQTYSGGPNGTVATVPAPKP